MFAIEGGEPLLCAVLPQAAILNGCRNHTIPGGRILQLGGDRYEQVEDAMSREYTQETGAKKEHISVLCGIGAPRPHLTGKGEVKLVQGFAGIVSQVCSQPRFIDEIAAVAWKTPDNWARTLATMNKNKQQLVLQLMHEARHLKRLYPCIKRELNRFLEQATIQPLQLAA
jgi:ADP-ribose pyrophosphatase YjhB (NUDIX family)